MSTVLDALLNYFIKKNLYEFVPTAKFNTIAKELGNIEIEAVQSSNNAKTINNAFKDLRRIDIDAVQSSRKNKPINSSTKYKRLVKYNKKFHITEFKYGKIKYTENSFIQLLTGLLKELSPARRYVVVIHMTISTISSGNGELDVRPFERSFGGFDYTIKNTPGDIREYVKTFFLLAAEALRRMLKTSKTRITFDTHTSKLTIAIKEVVTGGARLIVDPAYSEIIYSPDVDYTCFLECCKFGGINFTMSIPEIYRTIRHKSVQTLPTTAINKILPIINPEGNIAITLYKFKDNGELNTGTKYGNSKKTTKTIHMLLEKNHFMVIKAAEKRFRDMLKPSGFTTIEVTEPKPLELEMPTQKAIRSRHVKINDNGEKEVFNEKFNISQRTYFYDFECLTTDKDQRKLKCKDPNRSDGARKEITFETHVPYNVGFIALNQIFYFSQQEKRFLDQPYSISKLKKDTTVYYGLDSLDKFISFLEAKAKEAEAEHTNYVEELIKKGDKRNPDMIRYSTKKYFEYTFVAHNSGRYDHFVILKNPKAVNNLSELTENNGILMMYLFNYIKCVDFYRHAPESLAKLCKSFGLPDEYAKTEFPHGFAKVENLDYVGPVPGAEFWPNKIIPESFRAGCSLAGTATGAVTETAEFRFRDVSIDYQKLDVISLGIIYQKFMTEMYSITGINASNKLTLPSLAYDYVIKEVTAKHDIRAIQDVNVDKWLRKSILGGRCFIQKQQFKSESYDYISENWDKLTNAERGSIKAKLNDGLVDFDAVSLYPSAMVKSRYPVGDYVWVSNENLTVLMQQLNNCLYPEEKLFVAEVDYEFTDLNVVCPLIAAFDDSEVRRVYDCLPKSNVVLTSVDLQEAIKYNRIKVTKIHRAMEWQQTEYIFKDAIQTIFNERLKAKTAKNETRSLLLKLLMNSAYGKFIQRLIETKNIICDDNETMEKYILDGSLKSYLLLNEERCKLEVKTSNDKLTQQIKPTVLGAFILAYSKRIMNDCISAFDGFSSFENTFFYTDTDSMIITKKQKDALVNQLNRFGDSFVGEGLGQLHDDLGNEGIIIRGTWVQPKLYCLEYLDKVNGEYVKKIHIRAKGVNLKQTSLTVEDFEKLVAQEFIPMEQWQFKRIKQDNSIGIETQYITKQIGGLWSGRKLVGNHWVPHGSGL